MSLRDYSDHVYKRWRAAVRRRDKNTCQMPGCKKKRRLQAHHIIKWASAPSLRYEVSNGISLCWDCHGEVTKHEHLYVKLFMEIVGRKKK